MAEHSDSFHLKGSDKEFDNKKKDIFQQLESLETKYNNNLVNRFSTDDQFVDNHDTIKSSEASSFKLPTKTIRDTAQEMRADRDRSDSLVKKGRRNYDKKDYCVSKRTGSNKRKSRHDFSDPEKWTKYSLEDTEIGNENQNKAIALQFLAEQRARNRDSEPEEVANLDDKITFSRPCKKETNERDTKPKMYGSVFRMPECVVGGQQKPKQIKKIHKSSTSSAGSLVQLEFDFDDDNDDEKMNATTEQKDKALFKKSKQKMSIRKRNHDNDDLN